MFGMTPPTVGPPTMNQQQAPQGFGLGGGMGRPGQFSGFGQRTPGLSFNPLGQQNQMQMMIKALQQQGRWR